MSTGNLKKNKQNSGGGTVDTDIEAALAKKQDKLRFDTEPTEGSNNPVTSGGIKAAIEANLNDKQDKLTFDDTPTVGSDNPVKSNGVFFALTEKVDRGEIDDEPTNGSYNLITSDAVKKALDKKADIYNEYGGFSAGQDAVSRSLGGAIGARSDTWSGGAVGKDAESVFGGAIGSNSCTGDGFAGGYEARTINDEGVPIDAIQFGTGTNSKPKTMQVYDYTMMDADGTIPKERLADLPLAKTDENNNFTTSQTITGTLTVNGDIVQNGASYESHAEQLYTKNDLIKTRDGAVGGLGDGEYTGIEAEKYDGENNGRLVFDANGTARVGDVGNEQPLLTRKEATELEDYELFRWNADTQRATGVHVGFGLGIATSQETGKENLIVWGATETQINQRAGNYLPITVANLDYAVRSVLPKAADTIPSTLVANTEYYAGELATVSFALPTTGKLGQYCFVKFASGATATTLTVTGSYAGDIPTPVANKTYEILATWNGSKWVCSYRGY